jgi:hypothetical protein
MASRQVWWYARDGVKQGPFTGRELKALAAAGGLNAQDKVWKVGLTRWVDATAVRGLLPLPGTPVQPMPEATPSVLPEGSEAAPADGPQPPPLYVKPKAKPRPSAKPSEPAPSELPQVRRKGPEPVMESKKGTPWAPPASQGLAIRGGAVGLGVPEDLLRAFVGPKYDSYYKYKWQPAPTPEDDSAPPKKTTRLSLNWGAFCFNFIWLAYRKMYAPLLWVVLGFLPLSFLMDFAVPVLGRVMTILPGALLLVYGNRWYLAYARRKIKSITDLGLPEDLTQEKLVRAGRTSWLTAVVATVGLTMWVTALSFLLAMATNAA